MSIPKSLMMAFYFSLPLLVGLFSAVVLSKTDEMCDGYHSCFECLQNLQCGWCTHLKGSDKNELSAKCLSRTDLQLKCDRDRQELPYYTWLLQRSDPLSDGLTGPAIQIEPQEVRLEFGSATEFTFDFKFQKARDNPIDVYYLLDLSRTMGQYKVQLAAVAEELFQVLKGHTSQLQIGFGSFVDKVISPFSETKWPIKDVKARPYSFINHLPLTKQTHLFVKQVADALTSSSYDNPEGGLDALMQVLVCQKELNWRNDSQKIIVMATDDESHLAGDGKLVGIMEPNDGRCHLDNNGSYTHGLILDYPSISHIAQQVKKYSANLIFAVTETSQNHYESMAKEIQGASVAILQKETDIVQAVVSRFNRLSVSVNLTHNATAPVQIQFSAKCPNHMEWVPSAACWGLNIGDVVHYRATLKLTDCSASKQIIEIKPIGLVDSLMVYLKIDCRCECEKTEKRPVYYEQKSEKCDKTGDLICGRCSCPQSHYGHHCECQREDRAKSLASSRNLCRRNPTNPDSAICSGRGQCICGTCQCNVDPDPQKKITGEYCECDDFSCPGGSTCSGHGKCVCGKCICDAGWIGNKCDCETSTFACEMESGEMCSGRGKCRCGVCECVNNDTTTGYYSGKHCERCTGCKVECRNFMHVCVDCLIHHRETNCTEDSCYEKFKNITTVADVSGYVNMSTTSTLCQPPETDTEGCSFQYVAYYSGEDLMVLANEKKNCPEKVNVIAISTGVAGSVILAGILLLLIWKIATTIHDKREFEKFEKQRATTRWGRGDNPLYRHALTTHVNPTFVNEEVAEKEEDEEQQQEQQQEQKT